ncbi:MAG: flavodoxin domain-containing protein [Chloroflexota bacterium]|nr:flavodoxin domain-containing protein [Chloroflexota bacterium]
MAKVLVIYHSQTGCTEEMAKAVAEGASWAGAEEVTVKKAFDATADDLLACDAAAIGSPTYFGYMSGAVKDFFDRSLTGCRGKVNDKPFAAFASMALEKRAAIDAIEGIAGFYGLKKVAEGVLAKGKPAPEIIEECRELGKKLATS